MKGLISLALGVAVAATTFGATIDISTGTGNAAWQVTGPGYTGAAISLTTAQQQTSWAPAPTGTNWVSWGSTQGTSCAPGPTGPGAGCASTNFNTTVGDTWIYSLTISAAQLGTTSGTINFVFGSDDYVNLFVGNGPPTGTSATSLGNYWNQTSATPPGGFGNLGCSSNSGSATSAGNTQTTYNTCLTPNANNTISFSAANYLNADGSLTLTAYVTNAAIAGCAACGNPTGFVLDGDINTTPGVPEPTTLSMFAIAGLSGLAYRRKRRS